MQIAYLGMGSWGYCLASLLAGKGYRVKGWTTRRELFSALAQGYHPQWPGCGMAGSLSVTMDLDEAVRGSDLIVESVTSAGVRPVFRQLKGIARVGCPIVVTSKGIEQESGLTLPDVIADLLGPAAHRQVALLSGPSFAEEVMRHLPASVVVAASEEQTLLAVCAAFATDYFRVYPNSDIVGVAYGGALKNVIAIACGIAEGLALGYSCAAALITRGLHEMRKLAVARGARPETLGGLSGMGDVCLTCSSPMSRNFRFGHLLAEGVSPVTALKQIGTAVEGAYTCVSALQLSRELQISLPITEAVHAIIYRGMAPRNAVDLLMQRAIKWEHL